jgi:hypothetical protein
MRTRIVALAFVASLFAVPSFAADRPVAVRPVPVPIVARNPFEGFYAGGHVGHADANRQGCFTVDEDFPAPRSCGPRNENEAEPFNYNQKGWLVGGQVGFNHSTGYAGLVFGGEVDASLSGVTGVLGNLGPFGGTGDWHWLATADLKLGWNLGNWMLYAKGGISVADFNFSSAGCTFNSNHQGHNWGVGAEVAMAGNNSLFVDWTHHNFAGKDMACGLIFVPVAVYTKPKMDVIRVGFNHYFN